MAALLSAHCGQPPSLATAPGAGAAGGIAFGLMTAARAQLSEGEFMRAYGNRRTSVRDRLIPVEVVELATTTEDLPDGRPVFGAAVSFERDDVVIVAAVDDPRDGVPVVELVDRFASTDGVAERLVAAGTGHQDKVALYLYNCPEYLEGVFACFKASLVPVNTNYRYVDDELVYLWDNADAVAVIFHGTFAERIEGLRDRVAGVRLWLWVDDGAGACPDWAEPYEAAAAAAPVGRVARPEGRSGDDILMIYTGGTTGMPKGVMWRQDDLVHATCTTGLPVLDGRCEEVGYDAYADALAAPGVAGIPACPLMHGTG